MNRSKIRIEAQALCWDEVWCIFERLLREGNSFCKCGFVRTVLAAIGQPLHARVPGIKMQFGFQKYAVPVMTNYIQFYFTLSMTNDKPK